MTGARSVSSPSLLGQVFCMGWLVCPARAVTELNAQSFGIPSGSSHAQGVRHLVDQALARVLCAVACLGIAQRLQTVRNCLVE